MGASLSAAGTPVRDASYSDPDEAAAAIRSTRVAFELFDPPSSSWRVGEADLGPCSLWWGRMGAHSAGTGSMKPDTAWLVMAARDARDWALNRLPLGEREIGFVPERAEYVVRYGAPGSWFCVAFPREWLARESGVLVPRFVLSGGAIATCDLGERAQAARYAFGVASRFARRHSEELRKPRTRSLMRRSLLHGLLIAIGGDGEPHVRDDRRLEPRLLELLEAHREEPLYLGDLCAALGGTPARLRRLFRDAFGTTPGDFLRCRRLHLARRALRDGNAASVTEAAVRYGFFDLGRFAGSYRRLFGEPPSCTLRAARA